MTTAISDIDALIAEVERLRGLLVCSHHPLDGWAVYSCERCNPAHQMAVNPAVKCQDEQ